MPSFIVMTRNTTVTVSFAVMFLIAFSGMCNAKEAVQPWKVPKASQQRAAVAFNAKIVKTTDTVTSADADASNDSVTGGAMVAGLLNIIGSNHASINSLLTADGVLPINIIQGFAMSAFSAAPVESDSAPAQIHWFGDVPTPTLKTAHSNVDNLNKFNMYTSIMGSISKLVSELATGKPGVKINGIVLPNALHMAPSGNTEVPESVISMQDVDWSWVTTTALNAFRIKKLPKDIVIRLGNNATAFFDVEDVQSEVASVMVGLQTPSGSVWSPPYHGKLYRSNATIHLCMSDADFQIYNSLLESAKVSADKKNGVHKTYVMVTSINIKSVKDSVPTQMPTVAAAVSSAVKKTSEVPVSVGVRKPLPIRASTASKTKLPGISVPEKKTPIVKQPIAMSTVPKKPSVGKTALLVHAKSAKDEVGIDLKTDTIQDTPETLRDNGGAIPISNNGQPYNEDPSATSSDGPPAAKNEFEVESKPKNESTGILDIRTYRISNQKPMSLIFIEQQQMGKYYGEPAIANSAINIKALFLSDLIIYVILLVVSIWGIIPNSLPYEYETAVLNGGHRLFESNHV